MLGETFRLKMTLATYSVHSALWPGALMSKALPGGCNSRVMCLQRTRLEHSDCHGENLPSLCRLAREPLSWELVGFCSAGKEGSGVCIGPTETNL